MSGSGPTAAVAWRLRTALAVTAWLCLAGPSPATADPPSAVGQPESHAGFEEFLRLESGAQQRRWLAVEPGPGCTARPQREEGLPSLAQWWSRIVSWRASGVRDPSSDEAIVLDGAGYNYRRGPGVQATPRRF